MRIAIQAADLDHARIDGTRVYLANLLKRFGAIDQDDDFLIYHRSAFNPALTPPSFPCYTVKTLAPFPLWTQTRFARALFRDQPDTLWMPMHALPFVRPKNMRTVVTIHDLAFKFFPHFFPRHDLRRLNILTDHAVRHATRLIAVSHATKNDILRVYKNISERKISVIHHGVGVGDFQREDAAHEHACLERYAIGARKYILYVGAIQPRKNLSLLVDAFAIVKRKYPTHKLVLAGGAAWLADDILHAIRNSPYARDIILTGTIGFRDVIALYRNAALFVFPSLYEGFGMPILEAFAAKVPVVCARNSSIVEIAGDAALFVGGHDAEELATTVGIALEQQGTRDLLIARGTKRAAQFSWDRCSAETLAQIKGI